MKALDPPSEKLTVLFDGNCRMCRRTADLIKRLDVFHRIEFVNMLGPEAKPILDKSRLTMAEVLKDMHAIEAGKIYKGFYAYRVIARYIPALWIIWPFMFIWPVTALGRAIYRRVADSRTCDVPTK